MAQHAKSSRCDGAERAFDEATSANARGQLAEITAASGADRPKSANRERQLCGILMLQQRQPNFLFSVGGLQDAYEILQLKAQQIMIKVHRSRCFDRVGVALVCALLTCCVGLQRGKFTIVDSDFDAIAETSLKKIDPHETITTIVVPADTDPRARKALSRLRTVVTPAQVPSSNEVILPSGYFLMHTFRVELDGAVFEGQMGPVTRKLTQANLQDCGRIYSVPLFLKDSDWYNPNYKVATCDEKRIWWPADEMPPEDVLSPQQGKPAPP